MGIAVCVVEREPCLLGLCLLLTGKASYWSWEMQRRKITSLLLILDQGLLKSLCCKHLQQREILFSQFEE